VDLKIDDLIRHFLMGHAPKGISRDYVALLILQNGPAMRKAQEQISKRIFKLLGLTLGAHHDAALVPDTPNRVEAARKKEQSRSGPHRLRRGRLRMRMSAYRGRSEVIGGGSKRRD
jgi:hypothetical protein